MKNKTTNNITLGIFTVSGIFFLILMLYVIGKNENIFGAKIAVKAHFYNSQGLMPGNNIRFSGIDVGTVKSVSIVNDTTIEVVMLIKKKMAQYIRQSAVVSIGTDGLIGNKLINIKPSGRPAPFIKEGDILASRKPLDMDEMLRVFNDTNNDIAIISEDLKKSIQRINNSTALWNLLGDESVPENLKSSMVQVHKASVGINDLLGDLNVVVDQVQNGKGVLGMVLNDTNLARNLNEAVAKVQSIGAEADTLTNELSMLASGLHQDVENGPGAVHALLKDKEITTRLNNSLANLEKGTASFQENMEALKSNILFRGYFKKRERQQKQQTSLGTNKDSSGILSSVN